MAKDFSFDVVSDFDAGEMINAIDQAQREITTRFDFKGTAAKIDFTPDRSAVQLEGESQNQLNAIIDVLQSKLIRRDLPVKILDTSTPPLEGTGVLKWTIPFKRGLDQVKAKQLTKLIREKFPKAKTQIQGDTVRIASASKDDLQAIMNLLKQADLDFPLQFQNYR